MSDRPPIDSFVAMVDARQPPTDGDLTIIRRAVDPDALVLKQGALALAVTGAEPYVEGDTLTLLSGHVFNLDELEADDARPDLEPARRLLGLHHRFGPALFPRLRGEFVILLVDCRTGAGTVLRDQLGARGAVWTVSGDRVTIASEVQPLLATLPRRPDPDDSTLAHWAGLSGPPPGHTFFRGIHRIELGHLLDFDGRRSPVTRRYWSPVYRRPKRIDAQTAAEGLRTVLTESLRRRSLPGTGVMLSGGVDSSSAAAIASTLPESRRPGVAYSAVFPDHATADESERIALLCDRFRLESTVAVVRGGSALAGAAAYIGRWSIPVASPNLFFWLPLLERARADGVTRLLDGEGGDEIFGLSPTLVADRIRRLRFRSAAQLIRQMPGGGPHLTRAQVNRYLRPYGVKGAIPAWAHSRVRRVRKPGRYTAEWLTPAAAGAFMRDDWAVDWKHIRGPRWWAFLVDATSRNMGPSWTYDHVRRRALIAGIEATHPLNDVDVLEYCLRLPPELLYDTRHSRPILRRAVEGLTPDEVRLRTDKSFFNGPFEGALVGVDRDAIRRLLGPGAAINGVADPVRVAELLNDVPPDGQRAHWAVAIWRLATLELWFLNEAGVLAPTLESLRLTPADVRLERR